MYITTLVRDECRVHMLQEVNNPFQNATICISVKREQLSAH